MSSNVSSPNASTSVVRCWSTPVRRPTWSPFLVSVRRLRKNRCDLLSGGERRRTEIARDLATDTKFILLDEPFAGVDPVAVEDIQSIVAQLKNKNIVILITDHNVQETLAMTERSYLMFEGGILKSGIPEDLAEDPLVRKVYLGQNFELRKKKLDF